MYGLHISSNVVKTNLFLFKLYNKSDKNQIELN